MKIRKAELIKKLNMVKNIVPKKTTLPVLQGVVVENGYMIANDMEISASVKLEYEGADGFIIPMKAFDLISSLPDGDIEIEVEGNAMTIKQKRIKNKCTTYDVANFPKPEKMTEEGHTFSIDSEIFVKAVKRVMFAVAVNEVNVTMTSMCLRAAGGKLNFIGLDGHVIAWDKIVYEGEFELLIPRTALERLTAMGLTGEMTISHTEKMAVFKTEDCTFSTRLVAGKYFEVEKMMGDLPIKVAVDRTDMLDALNRAKMCIVGENIPVRLGFNGGEVEVSTVSALSDYKESVGLLKDIDQELNIAFNSRLLINGLKSFDEKDVELDMATPKIPMYLKSEESEYFVVVLPIMVKG